MRKVFILLAIYLFSIIGLFGQQKLSGGGDLNPDLKVPYEAQQKWLDLRIGLSVHWGPSSLGGKEIGWSRGDKIPRQEYDAYYKDFNPIKFDAQQWCELMKRWGVRYIAPTAKHHDGFALWFSDYSEYDMENAARKVDIMSELSRECKKYNIMLGTYYSNLDWYHPDWTPYQYGGPGDLFPRFEDTPNLDRYIEYMRNQITELIEKYGVQFVQFDGEWDATYTHEIGSKLYRDLRSVDPDVLLNSRIDLGRRDEWASHHLYMDGEKYAGDFMDRERVVNYGNNVMGWFDDAWQAWVTIDKTQWSHNETPVLMNSKDLIDDAITTLGNNGNYMINVAPKPDGSFDDKQIALMDTLGVWLQRHSEAIYCTRGGPYYPFAEGVSNRKGKKAWLFITDRESQELRLPSLSQKIKSATLFGTNIKVKYDDSEDVTVFSLPAPKEQEIRVIELRFREQVVMSDRKVMQNSFEQGGAERLLDGIVITTSSQSNEVKLTETTKQLLVSGEGVPPIDYAFHTDREVNPYVMLDLGKQTNVAGLFIYNRRASDYYNRAKDLNVWISSDGKNWEHQWRADEIAESWSVPFSSSHMGANFVGVKARYIKVGIDSQEATYLHLPRIEVYELK